MLLCCSCWPRANFVARLVFALTGSSPTLLLLVLLLRHYFADMRHQLPEASYMDWRTLTLQESSRLPIVGSTARRSLCPQISSETKNAKHRRLSFQGKGLKTYSYTQKAGNWKWLTAWWFALSIGPGYIKFLQPGLEVASNLKESLRQEHSQAPTTRPKRHLQYLYGWEQARSFPRPLG